MSYFGGQHIGYSNRSREERSTNSREASTECSTTNNTNSNDKCGTKSKCGAEGVTPNFDAF